MTVPIGKSVHISIFLFRINQTHNFTFYVDTKNLRTTNCQNKTCKIGIMAEVIPSPAKFYQDMQIRKG